VNAHQRRSARHLTQHQCYRLFCLRRRVTVPFRPSNTCRLYCSCRRSRASSRWARYHRRDRAAVEDYLRAFRLSADDAARELARFVLAEVRRDVQGVLENSNKHLRIDPDDPVAHARRGLALLLLGHEDEAEHDFARFEELVSTGWGDFCKVIDNVRRIRDRSTRPGASV